MKKIKIFIILFISLFFPMFVKASNGAFNISGPSTAAVGNIITINLSISSSQPLGACDLDLNYDRSFLQLTSTTANDGGTHITWYANNSNTKSITYKFSFKALKSGNTMIKVGSYDIVAFDESQMAMSGSSKSIRIQTQAEIEASYSDDAFLKSLAVEGYEISPAFDKKTYEYSLEVENNVEKVNVVANKSNANAKVEGAGEKTLEEGTNKVEIVVTSQKGNTLTYTLNITRKELNPIQVTVDNSSYTIVRKADDLPSYSSFTQTTVDYNGTEIPALTSDSLSKTLIALKDTNGKISTYVYENGKIKEKYYEVISNNVTLNILDTNEMPYKSFVKKEITINDEKVYAFQYKNLSKYYLVYALNINTGSKDYYLYDVSNNTFQVFDEELFKALVDDVNTYLYMLCASLGLLLICIIINIVQLKGKSKRVKKDKKEVKETIDNKLFEDIKDEEEKTSKKKKKSKKEELEEEYNILEDE